MAINHVRSIEEQTRQFQEVARKHYLAFECEKARYDGECEGFLIGLAMGLTGGIVFACLVFLH
jgi:hypothetical protein